MQDALSSRFVKPMFNVFGVLHESGNEHQYVATWFKFAIMYAQSTLLAIAYSHLKPYCAAHIPYSMKQNFQWKTTIRMIKISSHRSKYDVHLRLFLLRRPNYWSILFLEYIIHYSLWFLVDFQQLANQAPSNIPAKENKNWMYSRG